MLRSLEPEIMDSLDAPDSVLAPFHRDLTLIHGLLGNMNAILKRLRTEPPPRSVIDIGCGHGALLKRIHNQLGASVTGIDLRPPETCPDGIRILAADATRDLLPNADVAVSMVTIHHLSESELIALIRNVGRSCKRFVCLDLVRHPLPLLLFSVFVCPLLHRVAAVDGRQSIRRAFTVEELNGIVKVALAGTSATFEQSVSPLRTRQIIDIRY